MCLDSAPAGSILCYCWGNSNLPALDGAIFVKSSTVFLYQDKQKKKKYILIVPFNYRLHKLHCLWSLANGNFSLEYLLVVWASLRIKAAFYGGFTVDLRLLDILLLHPTVVCGFPGHPWILSISLPTCFHISGIPLFSLL